MPTQRKTKGKRVVAKRGARRGSSKGLRCPDCDFVAKHPMGLGRHRSTKHGAVSQRQARRDSAGGWVTRREAARRAGVHYNTIRHWEQTGRLRRSRRGGTRGTLVSASDLDRLSNGTKGKTAGPVDDARLQALERRFDDLVSGLERLVVSARAGTRKKR